MSYDYDHDRIREHDETGRLTGAGFSMPIGRRFRNAFLGHLAFWPILAAIIAAIFGGATQIGMAHPPPLTPFLVVAVALVAFGLLLRQVPRASLWHDRALVFRADGSTGITAKGSPLDKPRAWKTLNIDHAKITSIELVEVTPVPKGYYGFGEFLRHGAGAFPYGVRAFFSHGGQTLLWDRIAYKDDGQACVVQLSRALQEIREAMATRAVTLE